MEKLLGFLAASLEKSGHLQFYMTWVQSLLMLHGQKLKNRSVLSPLLLPRNLFCQVHKLRLKYCLRKIVSDRCDYLCLVCRSGAILPTLQALQKSIQRHFDNLSKL